MNFLENTRKTEYATGEVDYWPNNNRCGRNLVNYKEAWNYWKKPAKLSGSYIEQSSSINMSSWLLDGPEMKRNISGTLLQDTIDGESFYFWSGSIAEEPTNNAGMLYNTYLWYDAGYYNSGSAEYDRREPMYPCYIRYRPDFDIDEDQLWPIISGSQNQGTNTFDAIEVDKSGSITSTVESRTNNGPFEEYSAFRQDIRGRYSDYSKIVNFDIDENIAVTDSGIVVSNITGSSTNSIQVEKGKIPHKIRIVCSGLKKLAPKNGFYPAQRTLQLAQKFCETVERTTVREQAILDPYYAPGIMYNTIKTGLAMDWPIFDSDSNDWVTGSSENDTPDDYWPRLSCSVSTRS